MLVEPIPGILVEIVERGTVQLPVMAKPAIKNADTDSPHKFGKGKRKIENDCLNNFSFDCFCTASDLE